MKNHHHDPRYYHYGWPNDATYTLASRLELDPSYEDAVADLLQLGQTALRKHADHQDNAAVELAEHVRHWTHRHNEIKDDRTLYSDLLDVALDQVDYYCIARWLLHKRIPVQQTDALK